MEKSRISALVDGIFAVAMTLLVLDLKLPEGVTLSNDSEVWHQLVGVAGRFWTYVLSFIVLGMYWVGHHAVFHSVHKVDRTLLWLNLLFLLFVTLLPFSTNLVSGHGNLQIPVVVYGLNLIAVSMISLLQLRYLAKHPNLSHHQPTGPWFDHLNRRSARPIMISLASIALSFYKPSLAMNAYALLILFHFLPGKHREAPEVED
jgi:uncharacterized membrane protein